MPLMTSAAATREPPSAETIPDDPAPSIAREGRPIIAAFLAASVLAGALGWAIGALVGAGLLLGLGLILSAWAVWFFRDPPRRIPGDPAAVLSPADGVVVGIAPAAPPPELGLGSVTPTRISIFMNVFNVHVNRAPLAGRVTRIEHKPGAFFNASLDKASELNERCGYVLELDDGAVMAFVQIAGLVARRIVSRARAGDRVTPGQRIGLIRFGSRVDVYLPADVQLRVRPGERVVAGESVLGRRERQAAGGHPA